MYTQHGLLILQSCVCVCVEGSEATSSKYRIFRYLPDKLGFQFRWPGREVEEDDDDCEFLLVDIIWWMDVLFVYT